MSKYLITLEVESERTIDDLISPSWGALLIGANHNWQVIHTEQIEEVSK